MPIVGFLFAFFKKDFIKKIFKITMVFSQKRKFRTVFLFGDGRGTVVDKHFFSRILHAVENAT